MNIQINGSQLKAYLAKWGPNKLFGNNVDEREKEMSPEQLLELFDRVWEQTLKEAVAKARTCTYDRALEKLGSDRRRKRLEQDQEHREFRIQNLEFIAQLRKLQRNDYELTELWHIPSSDTHPRTLFVNFDTVEERQQFHSLAQKLGYPKDEELGKKIIFDFIKMHEDE